MNDLDAHRAANFKPVQLQTASQLGLRVPRTLVTNEPAAVRLFYEACCQRMIYKPLHGGGIAGGGRVTHTIFTSLVTSESLKQVERVTLTAHQFQEYIEKAFELRVTVIGGTALTVAMYSQDHAQSSVDWRAGSAMVRSCPFALLTPT